MEEFQQPNITVVDSIMGSGKSSWAIEYMNRSDSSFIYCTPYLDEIDRIKHSCRNRKFCEPIHKGSGRKIDDFNELLINGKDIAVTHCTFSNATENTLESIQKGGYTLILDEVIDVLVDFNTVTKGKLTSGDVNLLIKEAFITVDDYGKVSWQKESYPKAAYYDVERLAKSGNLFYLDKTMLVWQFPADIFRHFQQVFVLTYLFQGSMLKPYFEYHGLEYDMKSVQRNDNGYELCQYRGNKAAQTRYKGLIDICDDPTLNDYKLYAMSKAWYNHQKKDWKWVRGKDKPEKENDEDGKTKEKRKKKEGMELLQSRTSKYFRRIIKAKASDIMWTCPKDYERLMQGQGYTRTRKLTEDEKNLKGKELEQVQRQIKCFVPCNARATNQYKDRSVLAYLCNIFLNPFVKRYFSNKNQIAGTNIAPDEEYFALGCLLQWIWRSRIRDGKPIHIYIPSPRMHKLLQKWLDGEM